METLRRIVELLPEPPDEPRVRWIKVAVCMRHKPPKVLHRFSPEDGDIEVKCPEHGVVASQKCRYCSIEFHSATGSEHESTPEYTCTQEGSVYTIGTLMDEYGVTPAQLYEAGAITEDEKRELEEYLAKMAEYERKMAEAASLLDRLDWEVVDVRGAGGEIYELTLAVNVPGIGRLYAYYTDFEQPYVYDFPENISDEERDIISMALLAVAAFKMRELNRNREFREKAERLEKEYEKYLYDYTIPLEKALPKQKEYRQKLLQLVKQHIK